MIRAQLTTIYDGHPDSPRNMYETKIGRFTPEQMFLLRAIDRLEKKIDKLFDAIERERS